MNYLKYEVDAGPDQVVEVTLDHSANVQLMDSGNFANYTGGRPYHYFGGYVQQSPFQIRPPHQGHWFLVVDLGGYAGAVRASVRVLGNSYGRVG